MKQRKLFYAGGAGLFACTLASCGGTDYKALNFNFDEPTKDSKATVEYSTEAEINELGKYYQSHPANKAEFFDKYKSVMATYCYKKVGTSDKTELIEEMKSIEVPETGALYYYGHRCKKDDGQVIEDVVLETTIQMKDGKATGIIDLKMQDMLFAPGTEIDEWGFDRVYYTKKATGSLKVTITSDYPYQDLSSKNKDSLFAMATNLGGAVGTENVKLFTNEDKSYLYLIQDTKKMKNLLVNDNGLTKSAWSSRVTGFNDEYEEIYHVDYEYIDDEVISNSVNTYGYTQVTTPDIHCLDFAYYPFELNLRGGVIGSSSILLSMNESLTSSLTITEGKFYNS